MLTRPIGFSTGAIGDHDVAQGIAHTKALGCRVVELSVLRDHEFDGFLDQLNSLDLQGFDYCSVHCPSKFLREREPSIVQGLGRVVQRGWPIVLHPDVIHEVAPWRSLGRSLLIENMDLRKATGWFATQLGYWFDLLPAAGLCFDVGHAFQVDPTGRMALAILNQHGGRLRQVHCSHVDPQGRHGAVMATDVQQFNLVAHLIPEGIPIIVESPVEPAQMAQEMHYTRLALEPRTTP
jgi:hypothetical protein